ncbi:MAG: FxLYD domain-containing protein [Armatimonadetes bacterium]|nr:FxLYD domain-containing protein [Armatimonadota bacterium]
MSVYVMSAHRWSAHTDRAMRRVPAILLCLTTLALAATLARPARRSQIDIPVELEGTASLTDTVEVSTVSVERKSGFAIVTGAVRNTSGRHVPSTEAAVQLLSPSEGSLGQASVVVKPPSLAPGGTGSFRIVCPDAQDADHARITVREMGGPILSARRGSD